VKQEFKDPVNVISTGALWREKVDALYTRRVGDALTLSCETDAVMWTDDSEDVSRGQIIGVALQPMENLTLRANLHDSMSDATVPSETTITDGAGFSAETHLPLNSTLTLGCNFDRSGTDASSSPTSTDTTYDAQLSQPLGKLPLTAVFKGHLEQLETPGAPPGQAPSLEQSLVWKPAQDSTVAMGLRQQHYQEYPGIDNQFNQALFADWSQKLAGDVSWHSYAEMLNSRGMIDQAPAAPLASGANGTAQATTPGSNASLTSTMPVSLDDQTLTFSTGPSFQLQKDISASVEYSNRWDKEPAAGSSGQEQRISVSVKGTF